MSVVWLQPAQAAEAAAAPAADQTTPSMADIVVTARRVQESEQRVPIAITAIGAEELGRQHIYDARSLMLQVPGLLQATRIPGNPVPNGLTRIRGVAGIANYFGDVPYGSAQWSFYAPFFDIQNVQVLKGPQGTLFGQASNAGAIIIQPRRPGEEFGGYVNVQVGNYNQRSIEGALDLPLVKDRVFLRVAAKGTYRQGWAQDIFSGARVGKEDYDVERATLVVKATDTLENETMFQIEHVRDLGQTVWNPNDYDFLNPGAAQATLNGMTTAQWAAARDQILAQQAQIGPYKIQGWSQGCPANGLSPATPSTVPGPNVNSVAQSPCAFGTGGYAEDYALINKTTWRLSPDFTLKNIFSHTWGGNNIAAVDLDASRLILQDGNSRGVGLWQRYPSTWSDELQLSGKLLNGRLDFVAGGFFFDQKQGYQPAPAFAINNNNTATNSANESRTWAAYAQGNFKITDRLTFTGGLRYTHDYAFQVSYVVDPVTNEIIRTTSGGVGQPSGEANWSAISYTAGLQFQLNPKTMFYLTNAKGYSAGGLQNVPGLFKYDPDTLNNFELGMKSTFRVGDDWQVRTNVSAFYGFYDNVKVTTGFFAPIPGTNATQVVIATSNGVSGTNTARNEGFDFEAQAAYKGLANFRGWVTYARNHYTHFIGVVQATQQLADLSNSPFTNSPPWKFGIEGTLHAPIDKSRFGDLSLTAQYTYTSEYWVTYGKPITPAVPGNPDTGAVCKAPRTAANGYGPLSADGRMAYKDCAPALDNLNITLTWANPMGQQGLEASLAITNVLQNKTPMGISSGYDTANWNAAYPNLPRFIYLSLRKSF